MITLDTFSRFFLPPLVWNLVPPYLMMIFFLLFLGTYLDRDKLPSYFARSQKIYLGIYGLYCILNTAQILTGNEGLEQFIHKSGDIITFITLLLMGIFFISQAKKGDKKSRDLLKFLGIIILFGLITPGTFTLIFIRLNLIYPPLLYNTFPLQIGFTLGGFFITFLVVKEFVNMSTSSAKAEEHSIYLKEMDKKKTRLVMNMSHELRTPLTLIKGITSQLREGRWGDSIRKNLPHLDAIDRNSDRLLDQINDFLTLSRIEQDALVLSLRKISLDRYLALTAEDYSSLAASRNIRFSLVLPDGIFLHADPELLRTALENLLGNAFKFTPEGGEIILSAESSTGEVKLSLSDLGPGIPEEDREKIFAPFEQLEGEYSRGVGLGLSLVKESMKLHGGRAGVDSSPEGGSVFSLTFPYADEEPAAWEPAGETRRHSAPEILSDIPPGSGFKIMIVEDNRELLNYLVSELSPHFALICAENGEAALELYRENRPDLIISDIMMPRMDGWALFESLKDEAYPVPFLFLTARADREEKLKALDMGATDYLEKPFSARELLLRVKGILERSQREQDSYRKDLKSSIIKLVDEFDKERRSTAPGEAPTSLDLSALTRRETDIYHLIVRGYSDKQIGSELNISAKTVGNHNTSLFKKLGVASRMELILIDHS